MMLPNRIFPTVAALLYSQLFERFVKVILLQKIDKPPTDNTVYKPMYLARLAGIIGYDVCVVRHDNVSEEQEVGRSPSFIDSATNKAGDSVRSKDW